MSKKIFISQRIPDHGPNLLIEKIGKENVEYNDKDGVLSQDELIEKLQGKEGLLCLLTDKIDEKLFAACPDLKMVANYAVGFNNIDTEAAKKHGVMVSNTPGVLDQTTADLAFALMISSGRRIVEADKYMRAGNYKYWEPMGFLGQDINGATLGVIGMGRIGRELAKRGAKGFGMNVLYTNLEEVTDLDFLARKVELEELLIKSDFVSIHVPLFEATHHLIGEVELALMKKTAYLVNTSRGPVIDERALYEALKNNEIAGAGLDVYEEEPAFYPGLNELDNIVMVPHIGSASWGTRQKMSSLAAENLVDWSEGKEPRTRVA